VTLSFPEGLVDRYIRRRQQASLREVDFGYRSVEVVEPDELPAAQEGYGGTGWQPSWLVIATDDYLGDPIFTDLTDEQLPVFTAMHGVGTWEPVQIADSFEGFVGGLEAVASIAAQREHPVHPVGLEEHPLPEAERTRVLGRVRDLNPRSDSQFWEEWLTIEY
jgi:hypothetical protein